jgi:hypothetical protein
MKNKKWMKYLSSEQIQNMLAKAKTVSWAKGITNENMLAEWLFHTYDDCYCGNNEPTEEEIKQAFQDQYNNFINI